MALKVYEETDAMPVATLVTVIYGPPGSWKTSLGQTADNPITLDFDNGLHRSPVRKKGVRFECWADVEAAMPMLKQHKTVDVDVLGGLVDMMSIDIIKNNGGKNLGTLAGGLNMPGYGVLKQRFAAWLAALRSHGLDVVLIAHEKEDKKGDERIYRPDVPGSSYNRIMQCADMVGFLRFDAQGRRLLDFSPGAGYHGKNAANLPPLVLPPLTENRTYLADLLKDAKARIGQTADLSAKIAEAEEGWATRIDGLPVAEFNALLPGLKDLDGPVKRRVKAMCEDYAQSQGWVWSKEATGYVVPAEGPAS